MREQSAEPAIGVIVMYRAAWNCSMLSASAVGIWGAVSRWSLAGALAFFLFLSLTAACIRLAMNDEGHRARWRPAVLAGLSWGAATLAALGLIARLGVTGLIVVALLSVASPALLTRIFNRGRLRQWAGREVAPRPGDTSSDLPAVDRDVTGHDLEPTVSTEPALLEAPWMKLPVESMEDASVCYAWRTSYVALQQRLPVYCKMRIVERRQEFLDEFERRNPGGFDAWLASGARAAGDPTRYITSAHHPMHRHQGR